MSKSPLLQKRAALGVMKSLVKSGGKMLNKIVSNITKSATTVGNKKMPVSITNKQHIPKELPHYGDMNYKKANEVIDITRAKGKIYDENLSGNFNYKADMFKRMPSVSGRSMVDFSPGGNVPSQRFYKSTGLAGKKMKDGSSSKNTWVPLEGYGNNPGASKDWFIKSDGWDTGYGSKVMKDMGKTISKFGHK